MHIILCWEGGHIGIKHNQAGKKGNTMRVAVLGKSGIGGTETQLRMTVNHLHNHVEVVPIMDIDFPEKLSVDIAHIFHDILYARTLRRLRFAQSLGVPVVFSTIFWPCYEFGGGRGDHNPETLKQIYNSPDYWLPNSYSEYGTLVGTFELAKPYTVVYNAVEAEFPNLPEVDVPSSDILYVGRWELRKNLHSAIRAIAMLDRGLKLVLIGGLEPRSYASKCRRLLKKTGIRYTALKPRNSRSLLSSLMQNTRVLIQPSYFETPGLAALEAASCGIPIVVAERGSTKEYFAEYAYYCDLNPESIASAIKDALEEPTSMRRKRQRYILNRFTYKTAAMQTLEGYRRAVNSSNNHKHQGFRR